MSLYPGVPRGCTNCVERGYKCEEKEARQLRKGKRIAALEETYEYSVRLAVLLGLTRGHRILREAGARSNSPYGGKEPVSIIPRLEPEFFASPFFRRFHIQRPILDPEEFSTRYIAWLQDNEQNSNAILSSARQPLTEAGQLSPRSWWCGPPRTVSTRGERRTPTIPISMSTDGQRSSRPWWRSSLPSSI
jgi:hypothetical protein